MHPTALIHEIDRLVREGKLSHRQIALRLNVSRGTISAVARGRRGLYGREHCDSNSPLVPTSPPARCPHCGYRVYLPCNICRTRAHRHRQQLIEILASGPQCRASRANSSFSRDRIPHSGRRSA